MEIELKCLWHTDDTRPMEELGLDYKVDDLERRVVTFYRIDAISRNDFDDNHSFCNIHSGGEKWICVYSYAAVKSLLNKAYAADKL